MELYYDKFDNESKKLIKELVKENEKFNNLINKLKAARKIIYKNSKTIQLTTEEVKK